MGDLLNKLKKAFFLDDEFEDEDEEMIETGELEQEQLEETVEISATSSSSNDNTPSNLRVVNTQPSRMELLNLTMLNYDMTEEIAEYIKNRKPIIVNMEKLDPPERQRAVDFLTGACSVLNGNIERVTDTIFIFAPEHVNVSQTLKSRARFSR